MRIAVCSKDFEHVSGHAGQAKRWLIFDADDQKSPELVTQIELIKTHNNKSCRLLCIIRL